jgi:UDP-N-acetylmuramate dehydrogenase
VNDANATALKALEDELRSLAERIGAPAKLLPAVGREPRDEGYWLSIEGDAAAPTYTLQYTERGNAKLIAQSLDRRAVLQRTFETVTHSMASSLEVPRRRIGEDSRRQLFDIQEGLMARIDPAWGERLGESHVEVLQQHPFDDAPAGWADHLPPVRGRIVRGEALAPFTWFRVGGPAEVLFLPADAQDLADFVRGLHQTVPLTVLGVGSNTLVRDGGVSGVVVRLGRAFASVEPQGEARLFAGAAALDTQVARSAAHVGVAGLEFYSGIPGTVGGALTMNAGCYGSETKDILVEAYAIDRYSGETRTLSNAEMKFSYRHSRPGPGTSVLGGLIFTGALFQGVADDSATVRARMAEITARRESSQPIREKTGGSTFRNPPGHSAWKLVDEAGWRGKPFGRAMFSPLHANFMINTGEATASDLEGLGEAVRADVAAKTGVMLDWEIKRIGRPL